MPRLVPFRHHRHTIVCIPYRRMYVEVLSREAIGDASVNHITPTIHTPFVSSRISALSTVAVAWVAVFVTQCKFPQYPAK
jgi:hypothetical protein